MLLVEYHLLKSWPTCLALLCLMLLTTIITMLAWVWFPCSIWLSLVYHFFVFYSYTSSRRITVKPRNVTTILARNWLLFQFNCLLSWKTTKISFLLSLFSLSVYILQWTNFFRFFLSLIASQGPSSYSFIIRYEWISYAVVEVIPLPIIMPMSSYPCRLFLLWKVVV